MMTTISTKLSQLGVISWFKVDIDPTNSLGRIEVGKNEYAEHLP